MSISQLINICFGSDAVELRQERVAGISIQKSPSEKCEDAIKNLEDKANEGKRIARATSVASRDLIASSEAVLSCLHCSVKKSLGSENP